MWRSRSLFATVAVAALVAACGGSDDGGTVTPPVSPYVRISTANQDAVARSSIAAIMPLVGVPVPDQSSSPALAKSARAGATPTLDGHGGLTRLIQRALGVGSPQAAAVPAGMARPLALMPPETTPCMVSGTVTTILDDKDNSKSLTVGDSVSATFNQCDDGDGLVNGGMTLAITTYTQTPVVEDAAGSITFQSLAIASGTYSYVMDGGAAFRMIFALKTDGVEMSMSFTVGSSGMTVAKQGATAGGPSDSFAYRAGFTVSVRDFMAIVPGVSSSEIITASGDFSSRALGGDLSLTTITPFKSVYTDPDGDIFPSEGQLLVSGAEGTKLRLTATATVQVRMEMSDDADDDWEYSKFVDWAWLLS